MAIYVENRERLFKAAIEKIQKILDNVDYMDEITITLKLSRDEIGTVRYWIGEYIANGEDNNVYE